MIIISDIYFYIYKFNIIFKLIYDLEQKIIYKEDYIQKSYIIKRTICKVNCIYKRLYM